MRGTKVEEEGVIRFENTHYRLFTTDSLLQNLYYRLFTTSLTHADARYKSGGGRGDSL